jgi:hypothetical protein
MRMEGRPQTKYSQIVGPQLMGLCLGVDGDQLGRELGKASVGGQGELPVGSEEEDARMARRVGIVRDADNCASCMAWSLFSAQSVSAMMRR